MRSRDMAVPKELLADKERVLSAGQRLTCLDHGRCKIKVIGFKKYIRKTG